MYMKNKYGILVFPTGIDYIDNKWFGDNSIIKDIFKHTEKYTRYINENRFGIDIHKHKKLN